MKWFALGCLIAPILLEASDPVVPAEPKPIADEQATSNNDRSQFLTGFQAGWGDGQIEKAKEYLEAGQYRDAFTYLREGVQRSPKNLEGRLLLSEYFIYVPGIRDPERAKQILAEGVPYAKDYPQYLQRYISLLLEHQDDEAVILLAEEMLADDPNAEVTQLLATAAATAQQYRGNFDEAEDFIVQYDLEDTMDGFQLSARIIWERGDQEAAIAKLESGIGKYPTDEPIYATLSKHHRNREEYEKAREYAVLRTVEAPLSVSPRIDLLYTLSLSGQSERADREAIDILHQFHNDERAMLKLANYATDEGQVALCQSVLEAAEKNDFNPAPFALLLFEAHITASDYPRAISFSDELVSRDPDWLKQNGPIFNSLCAVAQFGAGDTARAEAHLAKFLEQPNLRVQSLLAVARRLSKLGGDEYARQVLTQAVADNPKNQAALTMLIEVEIKSGQTDALASHSLALLKMRRPSQETILEARDTLSQMVSPEEQQALAQLDAWLAEQSSGEQ